MVTTKNRLNGAAKVAEPTRTTEPKRSLYEGFILEHVIDFIQHDSAKAFADVLMARLNRAHAKGLISDLHALGRVAGVIEKFCGEIDNGNTKYYQGSELRNALGHLKKLDMELGIIHVDDDDDQDDE